MEEDFFFPLSVLRLQWDPTYKSLVFLLAMDLWVLWTWIPIGDRNICLYVSNQVSCLSRWLMLHMLDLDNSKSVQPVVPVEPCTFFFILSGSFWICQSLSPRTSRALLHPFPTFRDISGLTDAGLVSISIPIDLASLTDPEHLDYSSQACPIKCKVL